jgi:glucokinase
MERRVIGVDLGGTHFQIGVVDGHGSVIGRSRGFTQSDEGIDAVIGRLADGVRAACVDAGVNLSDVQGIGVGTPAPIDSSFTMAIKAVNLGWENVPLARLLADKLGAGVPVTIDNDVNAAVWGEFTLGAGRGCHSIFGMWIGTGIGGGLILDRRLHHGSYGTAGEIGRGVLYPDRDPTDWIYEEHASRQAIVRRVSNKIHDGYRLQCLNDAPTGPLQTQTELLTITDIAHAFEAGDPVCDEVIRDSARATGVMAANVVTLLSLDAIVLGGGVPEVLGQSYLALVREWFDRAVFPDTCRSCAILLTELRENAGLLGAAMLARERCTR